MVHCTVTGVAIGEGRYNLEVTQARAGNWVLLRGLGNAVQGTATVMGRNAAEAAIFKPLEFNTQALMKLAIEPRKPSELPVMVEALRKVTRTYPLVSTKVEESGEYTLNGTGELQLDCAMYDLRHVYSNIDIKVSNPMVHFTETVQEKYGWDKLAARSFWAFGPQPQGANVLLNDTLPMEVDGALLSDVRNSVVQGFRWACREGPLCEEPIRNVKFKILDATLSDTAVYRGAGQIIPTARRVAYSSFLLASPRLMEPFYQIEIQAPPDLVGTCEEILSRRRCFIRQVGDEACGVV